MIRLVIRNERKKSERLTNSIPMNVAIDEAEKAIKDDCTVTKVMGSKEIPFDPKNPYAV